MADFSGPTTIPEDPVSARLFPTAYLDDEEAAGASNVHRERLVDGKAAAADSSSRPLRMLVCPMS